MSEVDESRGEHRILEEQINEKVLSLERLKKDVKILEEESQRRRDYELDHRHRALSEKQGTVAKLLAEAEKLTAEQDMAVQRWNKKEELVRTLNELKDKLSLVRKQNQEKLIPEESSMSENEMELLDMIALRKASILERKQRNEERVQTLVQMEKHVQEREQNTLEVNNQKEALETELKELEHHLQAENNEIKDLKSKLANGNAPSTQSLYSEVDDGRQEVTDHARGMYKKYKMILNEIDEIDLKMRKVEEENQKALTARSGKRLATLESAYRRRVKDLESILSRLESKNEWPSLRFDPNDLNSEEFELFHSILESKKEETEKWNSEYGRMAQLEMELSSQAARLLSKKKELKREIQLLEEAKAKQATVIVKEIENPVTKKVHFALPDSPAKDNEALPL